MAIPLDATDPAAAGALLDAGYAALGNGDERGAEQLFRRAVQANPRSASAWRALAETQVGARHSMCLRWAEHADAYAAAARSAQAARQQPRARRTTAQRRTLLQAGAALAAAALVLAVGSDIVYRERFLPGVHIGTLDVGNMRYAAAARHAAQLQQELGTRELVLRAGTQTVRVPLAATLTQRNLVAAAFALGHEPSFAARTAARLRAAVGLRHAVDATVPNQAAIQQVVAQLATAAEQSRRDAQLIRVEGRWQVVPEQPGLRLLRDQATAELAALVDSADTTGSAELTVSLRTSAPTRTAAQLEPIAQRLNALASQPLTVQLGDRSWTLDRSMLMGVDTAASAAALAPGDALIEQQVAQLASEIAVAPQPSQLVREGNRVRAMVMGQAGRELDRAAAAQQIKQALIDGSPQIALPVRDVPPAPGEIEQLGLTAELGRGESQFLTYSSPERDANVETGGRDIDGVLVAPGETFSFTQTVGSITWEKGYRWGEAIEAGTVVPSLGGGICQVSTTVFRAAFWSGLEIVERHHHSWRLPWYEVDAPPGMDATIALGGPDLKIRNNTANYILIKAETDLVNKRQTVVIYGTPDGRQVQMQPLVGNIGVERYVIAGNGTVADEQYPSYYTQ